jgi:hypothetical protein
MIEAALSQRTDPWRQAVDEALIAHALDCTGPGDDPKEKVKELIEWAVTIATDPRVAEQAAEPKGMREALEDAARSLETISKLAGGTTYMQTLCQVRGYAGSRALAARAALAADQKGENE